MTVSSSDRPLDVLTKITGAILVFGVPLGAFVFLKISGSGDSVFRSAWFHQAAIAFAAFWGLLLSYVSFRCYQYSREVFLRYLTFGFLGHTIIYALGSVFTLLSQSSLSPLILYGPASRLTLAFSFLVGLVYFGRCDGALKSARYWLLSAGLFVLLSLAVNFLIQTTLGKSPVTQTVLEFTALVIYWGCLAVFLYRGIRTSLMWILAGAIVLFGISSFTFIFVENRWDYVFWLSHSIFAAGFVLISVGMLRARRFAESFESIFTDEISVGRLIASDEKFRKVQAVSPDVFLSIDSTGKILSVSERSRETWGYPADELIGKDCFFLIHPDDHERTRSAMVLVASGQPVTHFNNRNIRADGDVREMHWSAVWSERDREIVCLGRDVTELMLAERSLQRSQRLEAIGQLTGGVAHDFNNLLQAINTSLDALQHPDLEASEKDMILEQAFGAVVRGSDLTRQLLTYSRQQPQARSMVDLVSFVRQSLPLLRRTLGEQVSITFDSVLAAAFVFVDSSQLDSAIMNLAINARDAMPEGGLIRFTVRSFEESPCGQSDSVGISRRNRQATAEDILPGSYYVLEVSDSGDGMDEAIQARVFEPFFTTKETGKGSGLGLAMVQGFMAQCDGRITVNSKKGKGTTFSLYFPAQLEVHAVASAEEHRTAPPKTTNNKKRILLVEDNDVVREAALRQLQTLGYQVSTAETGAEALKLIEAGQEFDLLFSDVVMPGGIDGVALADACDALHPGMKVLLVSGYPQAATTASEKYRRYNLLSKPYRKAVLARAIEDALRE